MLVRWMISHQKLNMSRSNCSSSYVPQCKSSTTSCCHSCTAVLESLQIVARTFFRIV